MSILKSSISHSYIKLYILLILTVFFSLETYTVHASSDIEKNVDYDNIQDSIDHIMIGEETIDFEDYVNKLISGKESFSLTAMASKLFGSIKGEINANIKTFGQIIAISLIAAIFTNLSTAFKFNQVSETGYYVTYILLFSLLIGSFITASNIAAKAIGQLLEFMRALVPSYFIAVAYCSGSMSSYIFYEATLMVITLVDYIILKVVIPLVNFYLIIVLANNLSKEDMLSKLSGLIETIIQWILKSLLAVVIGFQTIQGLIVPVADQVKRSRFLKASSAIPGVGGTLDSVAETVIGSGILLKNAIGVAGLVVIIIICVIPIIKLAVVALIYKFSGAVLQPVSDKRIIECISATASSAQMLLKSIVVGAILFLLSITIVAISTGKVI
ncbi:MAG: stage III sporulation protein AF [Clostridiales bacterium]|nr:stage III sporulation protein AF [Clostridiales bacterium]